MSTIFVDKRKVIWFMRWAPVRKVEVVSPRRIRIWFTGCRHTHDRPLSDMIAVVNQNPQLLVGKEYWCAACAPGKEEDAD